MIVELNAIFYTKGDIHIFLVLKSGRQTKIKLLAQKKCCSQTEFQNFLKQKCTGRMFWAILYMVVIATSALVNFQFWIQNNLKTYCVFKILINYSVKKKIQNSSLHLSMIINRRFWKFCLIKFQDLVICCHKFCLLFLTYLNILRNTPAFKMDISKIYLLK